MRLDVVGQRERFAVHLGRDPGKDTPAIDEPTMACQFIQMGVLVGEVRDRLRHVESVFLNQQVVFAIGRQPQHEVGIGRLPLAG